MLLWTTDDPGNATTIGLVPIVEASPTGIGGFVSLVATTIPLTDSGAHDGDIFVWDSSSGSFVQSSILNDLLEALTEFVLRYEEWRQSGFQLPAPDPQAMIAALEIAGASDL